VGRPVAQKWRGTLIYDVQDIGARMVPGSGVRSSKTNSATGFHNENCCNLPPDFVALFCLQTAKRGGLSGVVSFESVYNELLSGHLDVLPRLYRPFYFDRVKKHAPGDEPLSYKPIFEVDGDVLNVNFSPGLVRLGYLMHGQEMDGQSRAALDVLCGATEVGHLCKWFEFQRGQIQVVNNRRLGHCRTAFEDWDEPEKNATWCACGCANPADRSTRGNVPDVLLELNLQPADGFDQMVHAPAELFVTEIGRGSQAQQVAAVIGEDPGVA